MELEYPDNLKYTDEHEYVRLDGNVATVGITAYAVDSLGDIVFVELPDLETEITQQESFGTVESVKAVSDLFAPLSGTVTKRNDALEDTPETLNEDPYDQGWLIEVQVSDPGELDKLMSADAYRSFVAGLD